MVAREHRGAKFACEIIRRLSIWVVARIGLEQPLQESVLALELTR